MRKFCIYYKSIDALNLYIAFDGVLHLLYYIFAMPSIQKRKAI